MKTLTKSINKTISTVVLASSLLLGISANAAEKFDVKALTDFMVEQNTQQVNQQLSQQLNNDIQFAVMTKSPTVESKETNIETLLAKVVVKNDSKTKYKTNGE